MAAGWRVDREIAAHIPGWDVVRTPRYGLPMRRQKMVKIPWLTSNVWSRGRTDGALERCPQSKKNAQSDESQKVEVMGKGVFWHNVAHATRPLFGKPETIEKSTISIAFSMHSALRRIKLLTQVDAHAKFFMRCKKIHKRFEDNNYRTSLGGKMAITAEKMAREKSLSVRAAWLHYAGGLTQASVAKRLGVPSVKAHRLIARAVQDGLVKVSIEGDISECIALENDLSAKFGLKTCEVAPDLGEEGLPLRALSVAGASFLKREIDNGDHGCIGIGHGRTLAASVSQMSRFDGTAVKFVSLLGGLTRNYSATPHDVMARLTEKTGATAYVMPVPFFANTVEDREVLLNQRGVSKVFEMAANSELKMVGIGTTEPSASLVSSGMIEMDEIMDVIAKGGVGELLGHFFDERGQRVRTTLTERTMSVELEQLDGNRIVAIAGGTEKVGAIRSVLMSGCLSGLITDERTAIALLDQ